ncbi:MAG TPA: bifunctional hydroxymethylpyrimidine kinase/phosphomethylpyrimidine kinase, partial [Clostridiales bacterium]|nr:bifunctional hydroxymethylpyrimidine kinase/phosphomethylpyrimidine kinase [Clostridiales bacterium]
MVASVELIKIIAEKLKYYGAKNIVIDPVMISTSGSKLLQDEAIENLKENLFPMGVLLTPNIPEASILAGINIEGKEEMMKAAEIIGRKYNIAVLCKGGHSINDANDVLYSDGEFNWFIGERINNENTHGTGCTLSSAIASYLALGNNIETSIKLAKSYISGALKDMLDLGMGSGPLNHMWDIGM